MKTAQTNPICLNCNAHPAIHHPPYGYMPCTQCQKRLKHITITETVELVPEEMKTARKEYEVDVLQRYTGDTPNLKYIKQYGKKGYSKDELKRARDMGGYYVNKEERHHG